MRRDAARTRDRILRAAEQIFAQQGVETANLRDINRLAGQANNSALHYHFGSREALLTAVIERHRSGITKERGELVSALATAGREPSIEELIHAIVAPIASCLATESGRCYVRMVLHMRHRGSARSRRTIEGALTADLKWILAKLDGLLVELPPTIRAERMAVVSDMMTATLASHAELGVRLSAAVITANLVDMSAAALLAPISPTARVD